MSSSSELHKRNMGAVPRMDPQNELSALLAPLNTRNPQTCRRHGVQLKWVSRQEAHRLLVESFSSSSSPSSNFTSLREAQTTTCTGDSVGNLSIMAIHRNVRGGKPSPYPRIPFHALRAAQLLGALVVSGIMAYFIDHLSMLIHSTYGLYWLNCRRGREISHPMDFHCGMYLHYAASNTMLILPSSSLFLSPPSSLWSSPSFYTTLRIFLRASTWSLTVRYPWVGHLDWVFCLGRYLVRMFYKSHARNLVRRQRLESVGNTNHCGPLLSAEREFWVYNVDLRERVNIK